MLLILVFFLVSFIYQMNEEMVEIRVVEDLLNYYLRKVNNF